MNVRKSAAVALAVAAIAFSGQSVAGDTYPGPWPKAGQPSAGQYAQGPVAAPMFYARHLARMKARHPGQKLVALGYNYLSNGHPITGEQVSVGVGPNVPCFYLSIITNDDGSTTSTSASCRGN